MLNYDLLGPCAGPALPPDLSLNKTKLTASPSRQNMANTVYNGTESRETIFIILCSILCLGPGSGPAQGYRHLLHLLPRHLRAHHRRIPHHARHLRGQVSEGARLILRGPGLLIPRVLAKTAF